MLPRKKKGNQLGFLIQMVTATSSIDGRKQEESYKNRENEENKEKSAKFIKWLTCERKNWN